MTDERNWQKRQRGGKFGEDLGKSTRAEPDEGCNAFYTRKQRVKDNDVGPDVEMDYVERDRDADQETNFKEPNASFLNYKKWDKYGRT